MKQLFFLTALIAFVSACKDKEKEDEVVAQPQVEIVIDAMYGYQFLSSDSVIFTTEEGYDVKLREMTIILTDIRNGSNLLSPAAIYRSKKGRGLLKTNGTSANFGNLSFNIGVEASINHSDPAAFPNDHALNILNASDMHWSWNPGYIFFKVEMIADTLNDGVENFNCAVTYHVGMDDCFQQKQISGLNWNSVGKNIEQLRLKVDIKRLLRNENSIVDIKTERSTHSAPEDLPLSKKLAENFKAALTPF